ncbi:adenylyltransferase/cytidyltransferase family protein [archaeon]|jgi:cytidyltransferase-like protein|nr:adenylyltransferase/cytidyltransferase family protein [archaeon]
MERRNKKVFVTGCFDCFHAGHAEFLKKARELGDVYVSIGSDRTLKFLKEITPTFSEDERAFIVESIKGIKKVFIGSGVGKIDFLEEMKGVNPDIFLVNEDGDSSEKRKLCEDLGVEYRIFPRIPSKGLPERSSTELRSRESKIPYRLDLAGGWLDQPYVSKHYPGPVLTISLEPENHFNFRSGMASSTRNTAIKLWDNELPSEEGIHLAKILFSFDNPPGTPEREVAGAQDSIGITVPGLAYSNFEGEYWPKEIKQILDEDILSWVEDKLYLVELKPRESDYSVFEKCQINSENAKKLSLAADKCFGAILKKDFEKFAESFRESFEAQTILFPSTFPEWIKPIIQKYSLEGAKGWKLSGAGGGGYLILVSDKPINGAQKIKIRRK